MWFLVYALYNEGWEECVWKHTADDANKCDEPGKQGKKYRQNKIKHVKHYCVMAQFCLFEWLSFRAIWSLKNVLRLFHSCVVLVGFSVCLTSSFTHSRLLNQLPVFSKYWIWFWLPLCDFGSAFIVTRIVITGQKVDISWIESYVFCLLITPERRNLCAGNLLWMDEHLNNITNARKVNSKCNQIKSNQIKSSWLS